MPDLTQKIKAFLEDLSTDVVEERVVEYVIREVHNGRMMTDVLNDPYVKNRLSEDKVAKVLENPEIANAIEVEIANSFQKREFGFGD